MTDLPSFRDAPSASCRCGQLRAEASGEPIRVSVCHCLNCQKRSGSAFAAQVRFAREEVTIEGQSTAYVHAGGGGNIARFHFCPACGATVYFINDNQPDSVAIPLGAFEDPFVFTPVFSIFENRKHPWLEIIGPDVEHD